MRILVAGVGNVFFGDDGFGPEVARELSRDRIEDVTIEDYGIRGLHLAYELTSGYDRAFLVDAVPRGGAPGTLYVIEPTEEASQSTPDAHRMDLQNVFAMLRTVGGDAPPITIVGCEPAAVGDGIGLSDPVRASVPQAVQLLRKLVTDAKGEIPV
jgi:hydrogenase maturation protease